MSKPLNGEDIKIMKPGKDEEFGTACVYRLASKATKELAYILPSANKGHFIVTVENKEQNTINVYTMTERALEEVYPSWREEMKSLRRRFKRLEEIEEMEEIRAHSEENS